MGRRHRYRGSLCKISWVTEVKRSSIFIGAGGVIINGEDIKTVYVESLRVLLLLSCLSLSGRAGPLPMRSNKLLGSLGHRSNSQGALLQAEWLRAEGKVGAIWPDSVWSRGTSTTKRRPR